MTGYETWVWQYDVERKTQSLQNYSFIRLSLSCKHCCMCPFFSDFLLPVFRYLILPSSPSSSQWLLPSLFWCCQRNFGIIYAQAMSRYGYIGCNTEFFLVYSSADLVTGLTQCYRRKILAGSWTASSENCQCLSACFCWLLQIFLASGRDGFVTRLSWCY